MTLHIEHIALWTHNLETLRAFYVEQLGGVAGAKYTNPAHEFESYFISFSDGARLELMQMPSVLDRPIDLERQATGWIHIALSVGSREAVNALTERLRRAGVRVLDEPRTTGDGYYESVVCDPDGNRIEITI